MAAAQGGMTIARARMIAAVKARAPKMATTPAAPRSPAPLPAVLALDVSSARASCISSPISALDSSVTFWSTWVTGRWVRSWAGGFQAVVAAPGGVAPLVAIGPPPPGRVSRVAANRCDLWEDRGGLLGAWVSRDRYAFFDRCEWDDVTQEFGYPLRHGANRPTE